MVPPPPPAHPGEAEAAWLPALIQHLRFTDAGLLLAIEAPRPVGWRRLVRVLRGFAPEVLVLRSFAQIVAAPVRSLMLVEPLADEALYYNAARPIFALRKLRVILWMGPEAAERFRLDAPDFESWISQRFFFPEAVPAFAHRSREKVEHVHSDARPEPLAGLDTEIPGCPAPMYAISLLDREPEAVALLRRALAGGVPWSEIAPILESDDPDPALSLALAFPRAIGDPDAALTRSALAALRDDARAEVQARLRAADHPDTLAALHDRAGALAAGGDPAGARALLEQVWAARTRVLGAGHPDTLAALDDLARALAALGDPAGARALDERLLEARTLLLGADHPDTLAVLDRLALPAEKRYDVLLRLSSSQVGEILLETRAPTAHFPDTTRAAKAQAIVQWLETQAPETQRRFDALLKEEAPGLFRG